VSEVIACLSSRVQQFVIWARETLAVLGDPPAMSPLRSTLNDPSVSATIHNGAVKALADLGDEASKPAYARCSSEKTTRQLAIVATILILGHILAALTLRMTRLQRQNGYVSCVQPLQYCKPVLGTFGVPEVLKGPVKEAAEVIVAATS
jgi:hypothetical protein